LAVFLLLSNNNLISIFPSLSGRWSVSIYYW
jgi:hypothetical protein